MAQHIEAILKYYAAIKEENYEAMLQLKKCLWFNYRFLNVPNLNSCVK